MDETPAEGALGLHREVSPPGDPPPAAFHEDAMGDPTVDQTLQWLPLLLNVQGRRCVVIGGGPVALRKARRLKEAGAYVVTIAPQRAEPEAWTSACDEYLHRSYGGPSDLEGAFLVIAATDEAQLNARIVREARAASALTLRADAPETGHVAFPATLRRGPLTVSFATDGISPAYAARLRRRAEGFYGDEHIRRLEVLKAHKRSLDPHRTPRTERAVLARRWAEEDPAFPCGSVALVGAGPGDPELLTLKAAERLASANVVLHDALANPALLPRFAPQARHEDVGKHKGRHACSQEAINDRLITLARQGLRVVRLKGGDPCLFGRGGEEALALARAGIPFEIVPGISSLTAVPAAAGIPITDREWGRSVGAFSLHRKEGRPPEPSDWERMAQGPETLVLFMGRSLLALACEELQRYGRPADQPAALIVRGTLPDQRVVTATLATLPQAARDLPEGPGLIVIGDVVRIREDLTTAVSQEDAPCPA